MKFLRAWWLQILGAVVVLGFLGWLVVAGGGGKVSQVRATPTPSPALTAQEQIEQVVKDFVAAYDLSAKTEDPSLAQSLTIPQSPAQSSATSLSDLAKQSGTGATVSQFAWIAGSWAVIVAGENATVDADYSISYATISEPSLSQNGPSKSATLHWHGTIKELGGVWKIDAFTDDF